MPGGEAAVTNWDLGYKHQVFALIAAGMLAPGQPTAYELADGPKALAELETRATVGKLALLP